MFAPGPGYFFVSLATAAVPGETGNVLVLAGSALTLQRRTWPPSGSPSGREAPNDSCGFPSFLFFISLHFAFFSFDFVYASI